MYRISKSALLLALIKPLRKIILNEYQINNIKSTRSKLSGDRRKFLSDTSKVFAAASFSPLISIDKVIASNDKTRQVETENTPSKQAILPRVIIIGAGIAGLNAAYQLKKAGIDVYIYEASQRAGGRIYTAKNIISEGLYSELGGEFIDSNHDDIFALAKEFDLKLLDTQAKQNKNLVSQTYFFGGKHYTEQQVIEAFLPFAKQIKSDIESLSVTITADSHSTSDKLFDDLSMSQYLDKIGLKGWLKDLLDVAYFTEFGMPITEQTSLNFLLLIKPETKKNTNIEIFGESDERYKIEGGNQLLTDKLAKALKGQIILEYELVEVNLNKNQVYELTFKTGEATKIVMTDILLITIPFSILKNISISPPLPEWKRQVINELTYGNNSKMLLGFKQRYWQNLGYSGYFFTDDDLQTGWDNSQQQNTEIGGLTIFSAGQNAIDLKENTDAFQANLQLKKLNKMYPGAEAQFNGEAARFVWPNFQWSKGSYACYGPGHYTKLAGNEIKPVGNIFFAGEHCSVNFKGFMNGGAETGKIAAEEIKKVCEKKAANK